MKKKCDVCGKNEFHSVVSSGLGAASFAYCESCLSSSAEPMGLVVWSLAMLGENWEERLGESGLTKVVEDTLNATGYTLEELREDVMDYIEDEREMVLMLESLDEEL